MTHRSRVIALLQATAQCAATFVRAVGRPNNDPLDRELHRCIAEERDVARFTAALGQKQTSEDIQSMSLYPQKRTSLKATAMSALCQKRTFCAEAKTSLFNHLVSGVEHRL